MAKDNKDKEVEVSLHKTPLQPGQVITPGSPESSIIDDSPITPSAQPVQANVASTEQASAPPQITSAGEPRLGLAPSATAEAPPSVSEAPETPAPLAAAPLPEPPLPAPAPEPPAPSPDNDTAAAAAPDRPATAPSDDELEPAGGITWTASEFIAHEKSSSWYIGLAGITLLLTAGMYLVTREIFSCLVVIVCAVIFGVYANHKPRQLQYRLDETGLTIGPKHYLLSNFRSFAVVPEDAFASIVFMPLKRFSPPLSIYYDPADEEEIVTLLADQLPLEEYRPDSIDRLMHRIRF